MARRKKHPKSTQKGLNSLAQRKRGLLVLIGLVVIGIAIWTATRTPQKPQAGDTKPKSPYPSLSDLTAMKPEELAEVDIALTNRRCAERLPGSESLNVMEALKTLDQYAEHVERETTRHLYRFRKNPEEYQNSEAYFRLMMMA